MNTQTFTDIIEEIRAERIRQDTKWGYPKNIEATVWVSVLSEESGEVARAVLEADYDELRNELIQVAAVAIGWVEHLDAGLLPAWQRWLTVSELDVTR